MISLSSLLRTSAVCFLFLYLHTYLRTYVTNIYPKLQLLPMQNSYLYFCLQTASLPCESAIEQIVSPSKIVVNKGTH